MHHGVEFGIIQHFKDKSAIFPCYELARGRGGREGKEKRRRREKEEKKREKSDGILFPSLLHFERKSLLLIICIIASMDGASTFFMNYS